MIAQSKYRDVWTLLAFLCALAALVIVLVVSGAPLRSANQDQQGQAAFTDRVASGLLGQIAYGFESRNREKVLGAFDLAVMSDGQIFKQQIVAFFAHTENIRIHINLVQTSAEAGKGTAQADVEMEAAPRGNDMLPVHKQDRLVFKADKTAAGWKFTDVQPRGFFSLQPRSAKP